MVTKYVNKPLAMGIGTGMEGVRPVGGVMVGDFAVHQPKMWIASAIGAGVGLASSLFGGASASKAAREARKKQMEMESAENASYLRRRYQDYVDTAAGQNLVRRAKSIYDKSIRQAQGAKAVVGGTDASVAQAKEAANKAAGDTIANIAANDTARKDAAERDHSLAQQRFAQMDMAREQQRAQNITQASQGASNAIMSAAGAIDSAASQAPKAGAPSLQGSDNKGIDLDKTPSGTTITGSPDTITAEQAAAQGVDADLVNKLRGVM